MAHRILELLKENGYKPATFARKVGVAQSTFAEILNGTRDINNVGVSKVIAIAKGFGVTTEYVMGVPGAPKYPAEAMDEKLKQLFSQLNEEGKERLIELADDMVRSGKYQKNQVQDCRVSENISA